VKKSVRGGQESEVKETEWESKKGRMIAQDVQLLGGRKYVENVWRKNRREGNVTKAKRA